MIVLVKCRWKEISQKNTSVIEIREAVRVTLFSNDIIPEFCDIRVIRIIINRNNNHYGCLLYTSIMTTQTTDLLMGLIYGVLFIKLK